MNGDCGAGKPEFWPVTDIHIGIVSSSLGAHGGTVCATPSSPDDHLDDKAHLIGSVRSEFTPEQTWNGSGFLAWDPTGTRNTPPGINDAATLATSFQDMVVATGEHGCGFEASLESWYRFLIDPEPPASVTLVNSATVRSSQLTVTNGVAGACVGCDETLLAQRKAFLRPDSLVVLVMMSDENDCSIRDDGVGWFVGSSARMPLSTAICATDPNNACCRSCAQRENLPPGGCQALSADATCKNVPGGQSFATWDTLHDSLNLRCYNQHQRFGFDLLYETQRYVSGLTEPTIHLQSNPNIAVTNPLFDPRDSGKPRRDPALVLVAGIVGVPWQDVADDASQTGPGLSYLTATELAQRERWSAMLGDPSASPPTPPSDPFMIETPQPRTGTNMLAQPPVPIVPANSANPKANAINGHEQNIPQLDDLQYACTFPLRQAKVCMPGDPTCGCSPDKISNADAVIAANSPICQPPGGGAATTTQFSAKAYPGARELQVLRDLGETAIVTSICPKVTVSANPTSDPNYGYNPTMGAIIERMKEILR
jgi:hypothetical protein